MTTVSQESFAGIGGGSLALGATVAGFSDLLGQAIGPVTCVHAIEKDKACQKVLLLVGKS